MFIPGESIASGYVRNPASQLCLDDGGEMGVWQCHNTGGHQYWAMSQAGEIRWSPANTSRS